MGSCLLNLKVVSKLPTDIKEIQSFSSFKYKIKNYLLQIVRIVSFVFKKITEIQVFVKKFPPNNTCGVFPIRQNPTRRNPIRRN